MRMVNKTEILAEAGRCNMASYCRYSIDGKRCSALYNNILERCPYLLAIGEIARLSTELVLSRDEE